MKMPTRTQWTALAALLLLLLVGVVVYSRWPDRKVSKAKELQKELMNRESNLSSEERRNKREELREVTKSMNPGQRQELTTEMRKATAEGRKKAQADLQRYFGLSQDEKNRFLDERIQQSEERRQNFANGNGPPGGGGRGFGGGGGPGGAGGPGAGAGAGAGAGGTGGGGTTDANSRQARDQFRQERLDSSTPAERAQFTQFFHDLNARRTQLGLSTRGPR